MKSLAYFVGVAFFDELDLGKLGFDGIVSAETGRPAHRRSTLLKIYIYGYLNRIQSSRRIEHETHRNIELMWLTGRLTPDFKTIADFRKGNGKAIRGVCRQFVVLCKHLGLFAEALVAIDGSKFKAVNNRDKNFTSAKLQRRMEEIDTSIDRYLDALDTADRQAPQAAQAKALRLQEKIAALKEQMHKLKEIEVQLNATPDKQISLADPDARSMKTRGRRNSPVITRACPYGRQRLAPRLLYGALFAPYLQVPPACQMNCTAQCRERFLRYSSGTRVRFLSVT